MAAPLRVFVVLEIKYDPESKPTTIWNKFFLAYPTVERVVWEGTMDGCEDLTVYFSDSEEPFPYSSLRSDSPLRAALEAIVFS